MSTVSRIWPELPLVEEVDRNRGIGTLLSATYGWICLIAALIWLLMQSDFSDLRNHGFLFLFLAILRILVGQTDLTSLFVKDPTLSRGSAARYITWSSALIFGPLALWLDFTAFFVSEIITWFQRPRGSTLSFSQKWRMFGELPNIAARDMLPLLVALAIFSPSADFLPGNQLAFFPSESGLYSTIVKTGLSVFFLLPLFILGLVLINPVSGSLTGLIVSLRAMRFFFGGFLVLGIPDLVGLISAGYFTPSQPWNYVITISAVASAALFIHYLNRIGLKNKQQLEVKEILERFSHQLLAGPPDGLELTFLLDEYQPMLFPGCWLEIFLKPDTNLYSNSSDQPLLPREVVKQLEQSGRASISYQRPIGRSTQTVFLVPIVSSEDSQFRGAIALLPRADRAESVDFLPSLSSFSSIVAAALHGNDRFEQALSSQAEAFHDELFAQAYEAEMTLGYQRMTQELALAGQIQNSFLPDTVPDLSGWQISVTLEPARETSGDYYDFIDLPSGLLGVVVADVTDKGIGSSLYMALSRTLIRTFALEFNKDPAEVLKAANRRILRDSHSDLFVTVFFGVVDVESGRMTYCNAGHNPPLLWRAGEIEYPTALKRTALPLGIIEGEEWRKESIQLLSGDVLALYTDGITEAQDENDHFFGEERLQKAVRDNLEKAAPIIEDKVLTSLANFTGDAPQSDDFTLMIIKRE